MTFPSIQRTSTRLDPPDKVMRLSEISEADMDACRTQESQDGRDKYTF